MLIPMSARRVAGLRRRGVLTWEAQDDDPHLSFRLPRWAPRHVVLVADGLDRALEPSLYFDTGAGFSEDERIGFPRTGRLVVQLDLARMPELRAFRFDPLEGPGRFRLACLGISFGRASRLLTKAIGRRVVPSGPSRSITLSSTRPSSDDIRSGLATRPYRKCAEHYADVMAQHRALARSQPSTAEVPLISFLVPTYNTKTAYLDDLFTSFEKQEALAELIFSDDGSRSSETLAWLRSKANRPDVQVVFNESNRGIAATTNAALAVARAPWIALVDHDDALSEGAVSRVAEALARNPAAAFLYTDEVIADADLEPKDYFLKPAYDPVLLSGVNYINHLSVFSRERLRHIGGFREGFEGSQDYDLLLRYLKGVPADQVLHLPYPAYIWRRHASSFSTAFEDGAVEKARAALLDRYAAEIGARTVEPALLPGLHRLLLDEPEGGWPRVSVIIPNRDSAALMQTVLAGLAATRYPKLEIVVADNDSNDQAVFETYRSWQAKGLDLSVVEVPGAFNFSRSVNAALARASGDLLLLLNNDIEIRSPDWLEEMVSCFRYEGTGIVGARLLYPDGSLQHTGVIVGLGGLAGHWFCGSRETTRGPMGRLTVRQSLTAVTGAAMLISRDCLEAVGPFDEGAFAIAYNDIDFCLRARKAGYRVVWTPFATLTHHESKSRGSDEHPERIERFRREQQNLRDRHGTAEFSDPAFNPWYTRDRAVPGLRALDAIPDARRASL